MTAGAALTSPPLRIDVLDVRADALVVVTVAGDVDSATAPGLGGCLTDVLCRPEVRQVVVDLGAVTFLDCAGLRVLAAAHRDARAGGRVLTLHTGGNRAALRPLEVAGLQDAFQTTAGHG